MGVNPLALVERLDLDDLTPPFRSVSPIVNENLELRPVQKYYFSEARVPCYEFVMLVDGEEAGTFHVRIESEFEKVREVGNVGIEVKRKFHGRGLPWKATQALLPFFREHGTESILITCDTGKGAIRKACEQLSASYVDTIETCAGGVQRDRFVLDL